MRFARLAGIVLLLAASTSHAQSPDPFDDQFQAPAKASLPGKLPDVLPKVAPPKEQPKDEAEISFTTKVILPFVKMNASVEPTQVKRGQVIRVTIDGTTKPWAYTYSAVKRGADQSGKSSKILYPGTSWIKPLYPITEIGTTDYKQDGETPAILHKTFQWKQDIYIAADAPLGKQSFVVQPFIQVCTKENAEPKLPANCYPQTNYLPLRVAIEIVPGDPLPPPKDLAKSEIEPTAEKGADGVKPRNQDLHDLSKLLVAAFVGAVLMLLTPCVFPMIPITVNFFIKQSEREHHRPFFMASVYAGTIVVLLTVVILLAGKSIIDLANDAWFNLGLGMVLILFALGLFGMFDVGFSMFFGTILLLSVGYGLARLAKAVLPGLESGEYEFFLSAGSLLLAIPVTYFFAIGIRQIEKVLGFEESAILNLLARQESRGGMLGAVFMAMTFTITSFSCTGPFLGILLAPLAGTTFSKLHLILAALVYACTFAAPFFVLALFPTYLKKLPKSGGWMTTIKVTMGFLEIGAALKFLSIADLSWFPGNPRLFNYDTVLCSWIALSFACSMYLFGIFHLHHDTPEDHIGVPRMIFASLFLGMALYLTPLLFGITPRGLIMESVVAFLPPDSERPGQSRPGAAHDSIDWIKHDYEKAWKQAVAEKKLIFIDFTGTNCPNCRVNERNIFPQPAIANALKRYVCIKLFTDSVPDPKLYASQALAAGELNKHRQTKLINDVAQPSYVIVDPNPSHAFVDNLIDAKVIDFVTGKINDVASFERFLTAPQQGRTAAGQRIWIDGDFNAAQKEAAGAKKLLLVAFEGTFDVNGLSNRRSVLDAAPVCDELERFVCVSLSTDFASNPKLSSQQAAAVARCNQEFQIALTRSVAVPMYVVMESDGEMKVIGSKEGRIELQPFVEFLRKPAGELAASR